ncbi:MAG TPA: NAD-dependent DNA ligase LigA, partial [Caldisericia bacterium]|nr:NAD-dependent DNA ligase LigA [Caldisericia bacterium]
FDSFKYELKKRNPKDIFFKKIGSEVPNNSVWQKAKHKIPMGSLDKVNTIDEFKEWCFWINKKHSFKLMIFQEKLDGISIDNEYENGKLIKGITRGDGIIGEDITKNVIKMKNVKQQLSKPWSGSLRGEIILLSEDFEKINSILEESGEKPFKNLRNAASGIAKRFDGRFSEYLTILYYDCTGNFKYENEKIDFIQHLGLKNVPTYYKTVDDGDTLYNLYEKLRPSLGYDIDGLVAKIDSLEIQNELGIRDGIPQGQIAWKFPSMKVKSKIIDVEWQMGPSGRYTPVAILEPVKMGGVTVQRASLHNFTIFSNFDFHYKDEVIVSRQNDVIPQVIENLSKTKNGIKIPYLKYCAHCDSLLKVNGEFLICENPNCSGKQLGNLKKWANVVFTEKGFAGKTVEILFENGLIKEPADFYKLKKEDLLKLPKFGSRKADIVLNVINEGKTISLPDFIGGLNFENFGRSRVELLMEHGYKTLSQIMNIKKKEIININGMGESISDSFFTSLKLKENQIKNLLDVGVKIKENKVSEQNKEGILKGKSFVFTGAIQRIENGKRLTREIMEGLVKENGGEVLSKVRRGLTYLVQADPNSVSSKSVEAKKLGVTILSEENFFKMIGK